MFKPRILHQWSNRCPFSYCNPQDTCRNENPGYENIFSEYIIHSNVSIHRESNSIHPWSRRVRKNDCVERADTFLSKSLTFVLRVLPCCRVKGREEYFCSLSPKTSKLLGKDSDFYKSLSPSRPQSCILSKTRWQMKGWTNKTPCLFFSPGLRLIRQILWMFGSTHQDHHLSGLVNKRNKPIDHISNQQLLLDWTCLLH